METYFIVTNLFLTNITWINDWYWPMIEESILKIIFFISKLLQHHYSTLTNDWDNEWKICPSSKWNYFFFISKLLQHHFSTLTNDWYKEAWIIDISILKIYIFFLFRNYYSIIPALWPMTDIMNDRYIHPQN